MEFVVYYNYIMFYCWLLYLILYACKTHMTLIIIFTIYNTNNNIDSYNLNTVKMFAIANYTIN